MTAQEQYQQEAEAARLLAEAYSDTAPVATRYRDVEPVPTGGTAAPVVQPGRPPMSQRATDVSALMLAGGVASVPVGGSAALVLYVAGQADPVALAAAGAIPVGLTLAVGLAARMIGRAVRDGADALPAVHHHHGQTQVTQVTTTTRGIGSRTQIGGGR